MADLLISIDDFKQVCGVSKGFDSNYIYSMIEQATDLATQNLIGTALLVKIRTDYNTDEGLTGVYATLWDSDYCSLKKVICWQTYQLTLPRMFIKIGAEGITYGDTSDVNMVDSSDIGMLTRQADASRVGYENRLKTYLQNNKASIPELSNTDIDYLKENTEKSDTSMGLSFGKNNFYENF